MFKAFQTNMPGVNSGGLDIIGLICNIGQTVPDR